MAEYRQLSLFTRGGRVFTPEAERAELKVDILNGLCQTFHYWNAGCPLELPAGCELCGAGLRALVMLHGLSVAYCPDCGWHREVQLNEGVEEGN